MYAHLSSKWIANGCFIHLVTVLAHDQEMIDSLFWLGFGMVAVDALRDLHNVHEGRPSTEVEIRRADLDDLELVMSLNAEYQRYMAGSPIYLALVNRSEKGYHEKWLSNPSNALWLASYEGEIVSYMKIGPFSEDAAYVISDEKTASITGAYTKENHRGKGIGTTLLNQSLSWARSEGYERCAVDFEPENVLGSSFWLKHFKPICFSLIRQIDHRIAWAHKNRKDEHFW
jgi:GNAT superfamily N-acetyltransferase